MDDLGYINFNICNMTAINIEMIEKNTELLLHETRRLTCKIGEITGVLIGNFLYL